MELRIPSLFYDDVKDLRSVFTIVGREIEMNEEEVDRLFNLLPASLQQVFAFHDRITKLWRYEFGQPIDRLSSETIVVGTHMFPEVNRLLRVLSIAYTHLTKDKLYKYIQRLNSSTKHQDVLAEMSPLFWLSSSVNCEFEVSGYAEGNRTVDWVLSPTASVPVLLDVKYRMRDLIEGLDRIMLGHRGIDGGGPDPMHNTSLLFKDTEEKFVAKDPSQMLQGVWIISQLQQDQSELHSIFNSLNPQKLHFAILTNWSKDAYVLTRDKIKLELLLTLFGIKQSDRFVFNRN